LGFRELESLLGDAHGFVREPEVPIREQDVAGERAHRAPLRFLRRLLVQACRSEPGFADARAESSKEWLADADARRRGVTVAADGVDARKSISHDLGFETLAFETSFRDHAERKRTP